MESYVRRRGDGHRRFLKPRRACAKLGRPTCRGLVVTRLGGKTKEAFERTHRKERFWAVRADEDVIFSFEIAH